MTIKLYCQELSTIKMKGSDSKINIQDKNSIKYNHNWLSIKIMYKIFTMDCSCTSQNVHKLFLVFDWTNGEFIRFLGEFDERWVRTSMDLK